jgi:hypothetical protein
MTGPLLLLLEGNDILKACSFCGHPWERQLTAAAVGLLFEWPSGRYRQLPLSFLQLLVDISQLGLNFPDMIELKV